MSGFSNVLKNGWHPDKDTDFKKQVVSFLWVEGTSASQEVTEADRLDGHLEEG